MKVFKVPGKVRKWIAIFTRHFFMKIFKVPGKVPIARALSKKQWMLTGGSAKMLLFGLKCRNLRVFLQFCWNVEIYALCRILAEMLRFTRFPRQKLSAARHLKLFCTPDGHTIEHHTQPYCDNFFPFQQTTASAPLPSVLHLVQDKSANMKPPKKYK